MKLKCFLLPSLVFSLLGHPGYAGPNNPKRGGALLGVTSTNSGDTFGKNDGDYFGGSGAGISRSSGILGGNIGGATTRESLGSVTGGPLESLFGNDGGSSAAANCGADRVLGFPSAGYGTSTGLVDSPLGAGLGGISSIEGAGVAVSRGGEGNGYLPGNAALGGRFGESTSVGAGRFRGDHSGDSTATGHPLSRNALLPRDSHAVMAGVRSAERPGNGALGRGLTGSPSMAAGPFGGDQPVESTATGIPLSRSSPLAGDSHNVMVAVPSSESPGTGSGASRGYSGIGRPGLPERVPTGTGFSGVGVPLGPFPSSPSRSSPGDYGTGAPEDVRRLTGSRGANGGPGAGLRGFGRGVPEEIGGIGTRLTGLERRRNSLGLGGGTEGSLLARLRDRIYARARAFVATNARARARAKARARARAFTLAKLRARLHAALNKRLRIRGGIYAGLDKEVELTGALGGGAGLQGEGGAGPGFAGHGGPRASAGEDIALYGGTVGPARSLVGFYGGDYEFYSE